jgi:alkylation response protein AidB-like acyl-CoA dehydrogenase
MAAAEELLFTGNQRLGVGKGLFFGRFVSDWVMPYPVPPLEDEARLQAVLEPLREFLDTRLDPVAIDREATIPSEVVRGLAEHGVLGMTAPPEYGGRGFGQLAYCRVMQEIGARCASTSVFVNAHHSIGMRALLLFGTPAQKRRWLPPLARGETLAAFALTEPEAGSDAANVQTEARPAPDGSHYILNGEKRYITNGAIAGVLTVMARTPAPDGRETAVTAFLVTPDMPGFEVTEPRMAKLGVRGTATARLAFRDLRVPAGNILGAPGKGLKVALTVLDFGRTTFGACCSGAAKTCLQLAIRHATTRRQFGRPLAEFELVRQKIAGMAADIYAMEAMTAVTAALIDRELDDYMLETAMLKVFTTEALWTITNDAFQIHGGAAYFTDRPLERLLRDARINQIGEGANEVLVSFIALAGMRGPGQELRRLAQALRRPVRGSTTLWDFLAARAGAVLRPPAVPVTSTALQAHATELGRLIRRLHLKATGALIRYREEILERQYIQERIARAAIELFACACVLSRRDRELTGVSRGGVAAGDGAVAELFLRTSLRRAREWLAGLDDNDDTAVTAAATGMLESKRGQIYFPAGK